MIEQERNTVGNKGILWIGALLVLIGVGIGAWYYFTPHGATITTSKAVMQEDDYTCPMHQQVHSDKPGDCPICGMKLVKRRTLRNPVKQAGDSGSADAVMFSQLSAVRANVSTVHVERRTLHNEIRLPGTIEIAEPNERMITARTRGRVEKLYVRETGTYIKAGMALYEFYSPDLSSNVAQYIIAKNAQIHTTEHDHAGLNMESAARERLKLYGLTDAQIDIYAESTQAPQTFTVYARASGTVIKKNVVEGVWLDEGTMLYQIAELSTVWANFDIPQNVLSLVRIGQNVAVSSSAYGGTKFSGKVIFISPVLNESTRTARIRVALANPSSKLRIQMAVEGYITLSTDNALTIPVGAVVRTGNENIVWVKQSDGMFYPHKVILGFLDAEDNYAVLSGLEEGDLVAASGTFLIDSEHQLKTNSPDMPGMDMKSDKK